MQWILRFRVFIIIFLAVMLISAAVIFSVVRTVLPHATGYKLEIQQEVSKQIGLPVEIKSIDAAIHWFSPRLKLLDVTVYGEQGKIALFYFKEAFVELDVIASILHAKFIVADVGLVGVDISIEKLSDKEWLIQGVKISGEGSEEIPEELMYMLLNSNYLLHDSNIHYQDNTGDKLSLSLLDINIDVDNSFNRHQVRFSMNLPEVYGQSLAVMADLYGDIDALDGDVYISVQKAKTKNWGQRLALQNKFAIDALIDFDAWAKIKDNNIESLIAELSADDVLIKNNETDKIWQTDFLSTKLRFVQKDEKVNVSISDLYFGAEDKPDWPQLTTLLFSEDDEFYYLSTDFLRLSDVLQIADVILSDKSQEDSENILDQIKSYQLQADIYNLNLQLPKDLSEENLLEKLDLEVTLVDFAMLDDTNDIAISGLDTTLKYNKQRAVIGLQSEQVSAELKQLYSEPLQVDILQGEITLEKVDLDWHIKTDKLQLKNSDLNAFSRLDLSIPDQGEMFIDLQTDFYDLEGKTVRHYLPADLMSATLLDWLNMAITDGYFPAGTLLLHGDPAAYPYQHQNGVFQVMFSVQDMNMQFLEDWPLLNDVSAQIEFDNASLFVSDIKASTMKLQLYDGYVEILDLQEANLIIETYASAATEEMQAYVLGSPLVDDLGDTMSLFQFAGQSKLSLKLDVPLEDEVIDVAIDGELLFLNTQLYYPDLGYQLDDVNGVISFTDDTIFADSISAEVDGKPVSIAAFTDQGDSGQQVGFDIHGVMSVDYLLQDYRNIAHNLFSGSSEFSIKIAVPNKPKDYRVHVDVYSDLKGILIEQSDKVSKPAADKLDFTASINILDGGHLRVESSISKIQSVKAVRLVKTNGKADGRNNKLIDVFAARNEDVWSIDLTSRYMKGKAELTEGLGKETVIKLNLENIDLHAMVVSEKTKAASTPLLPADFPSLDWKVKTLLWDDWEFTDVILESNWHKNGMVIGKFSLKGPAMTFNASGTWLTSRNGSQETKMSGKIRSTDCGTTLVGLGYARSLDRCKFKSSFTSTWPAEPYALSWANMTGNLSFKMKDGAILDVNPGAGGRLLGLLNIFQLTNRLTLNFDDVTKEGFSFDKIKGDFEFVNGNGSLNDVNVTAPAADVNIFGSIGMVKHDYGLLMRVKPHTDSLTLAGGALLAGPIVGAGLTIIQKLFDLSVIGHTVYSVTGTWDDPVFKEIISQIDTDTDTDEADDFHF